MHIPDGYLSPATCAVGFVAAAPFWVVASRRVTKVVKTRNVPVFAVLAALSFLIMMFNVPIPDGTTAHAVGGALIAIILGPWAAVIAVSVALLLQALLFGDGGVLSFGANCVNMAVILPFVSYGVYRLLAGRSPLTGRRRVVAAAIGGYVGINAAALAAAVEFGIQPDLFHTADGTPLYSPYHLSQSIPAMMVAHLTVAGFCEAVLCAAVLAYLQRADVTRLVPNHRGVPLGVDGEAPPRRRLGPGRVAIGGMVALAALSPLGLLAPGGAFGEDAPADLNVRELGLRTVPAGLAKLSETWQHALLGDYGFGSGDHPVLGYILSAFVGILIVGAVMYGIGKLVQRVPRGGGEQAQPAQPAPPANTSGSP